jgi:uncharacterized repeat protein (TIGR01451 family)
MKTALLLLGLGILAGALARAGQVEIPAPAGPATPGSTPAPLSLDAGSGPLAVPKQSSLPPAFRVLIPSRQSGKPADLQVPSLKDPVISAGPASAIVSPAALTVEKHGPVAVQLGQSAVYEIVVRNNGATPASGLRIEDDLPAGTRFLGATPPATVQGQHLSWSLEILPPTQESRYHIETIVTGPGDMTSRATVSQVVASTTASTRVLAPAVAVKLQSPEAAVLGQMVDLKIQIVSVDGQARSGVVLLVRLPAGLKHEAGKEIETDPFTISAGIQKDIDLHVQAVGAGPQAVEALLTLGPGQQLREQASVLVTEPTQPPAPAPRLRTSLVIHKVGPQRAALNQRCDYRLEVENRGPVAITDVTLYDRLPPGLEMGAASNDGVYDAVTRSVQWRLGTLAPRQKRTVTLRIMARTVGEQRNQVWVLGEPNQEAHLTATMQIDSRDGSSQRKNK